MQKNFSYPLIVEDIAAAEKKYRLTADAADLKELAEILKIFQRRNLYQNEQKRTFAPGMGAG